MTPGVAHWDSYWEAQRVGPARIATEQVTCDVAVSLLRRYYRDRMPKELWILDLGCGDGRVTCRVSEALRSSRTEVMTIGCDWSMAALAKVGGNPCRGRVAFVQGDAGRLPFRGGSFHGAMSFGYSSVASYGDPAIQQEVFRVIKPGGWLIVDFRNHLSLWFFLLRPWWVAKWVWRFLGLAKPQYHLATLGLGKYFAESGFEMRLRCFLLSFPPLSLPVRTLLAVERICAVLRMQRFFGRVFFGLFSRSDHAALPDVEKG